MFSWFRRKKQDPRQELLATLGDAELPTFPALLSEILQTLRDADTSMAQVGAMVAQDPALTVKVIKTVNSASFGLRRRVDSVNHAVTLLGRSRLESIVLPLAVGEALPGEPGPGFDPRRFWQAAARRAVIARELAGVLEPASRDVSYTAGLLQDMAIPLLVSRRPDTYGPVLERWHRGEGALHVMERAAFGWTHAEVAGWLCADWDFPEGLAAAITGHHGSDDPEVVAPAAVRLVALLGEGEEREISYDPLIAAARDEHGASEARVVDAIERAVGGARELGALFAA